MSQNDLSSQISQAAQAIRTAQYCIAFTGAGISVESGIPPFRGQHGLWSRYDPNILDLDTFFRQPAKSWKVIKEIFYDFFGQAKPNAGHISLAQLEQMGLLRAVITQNIDNLHQEAGSKTVYEFHGTSHTLVCMQCNKKYTAKEISLAQLPPICSCGGPLKPDFIFFGEGIPENALRNSFQSTEQCDLMLVIGTTGEVMPASQIPKIAHSHGATIIEINPEASHFTHSITDIFLNGKAGEILPQIVNLL